MPALYIGHGAPPLLDDRLWTAELSALAGSMPRPRAILIVSAHWESAPMSLSATGAATPLVYDFGGFAPGPPRPPPMPRARLVASVLPDRQTVHQHPSRGLDHGAWVPLTVMYPEADVPVLQLSLPTSDPARLLDLGRRLRPLRDHGVLIIGSGYLTHGLPFLRDWSPDAKPPGWSVSTRELWAAEALSRGDLETLSAFGSRAPGMPSRIHGRALRAPVHRPGRSDGPGGSSADRHRRLLLRAVEEVGPGRLRRGGATNSLALP